MIRDILVHLDGTDSDEVRIAHAEHLAVLFQAHLTGLHTNLIATPFVPADGGFIAADVIEAIQAEARERGDQDEVRLRHRLDDLPVPTELHRHDVHSDAVRRTVAQQARACDVFVALRPYGLDLPAWPDALEGALFGSGRGVYVAPPGTRPSALKRILIAWSDTREAARAVAEAMPLLRQAEQVVLVTVDRDGPAEENQEEPDADIARHLDRHGVKLELRHLPRWDSVCEAVLNEAEKLGANLIVVGAYGHSRLREWVFGGTTRDLLTQATIPMFMAH